MGDEKAFSLLQVKGLDNNGQLFDHHLHYKTESNRLKAKPSNAVANSIPT